MRYAFTSLLAFLAFSSATKAQVYIQSQYAPPPTLGGYAPITLGYPAGASYVAPGSYLIATPVPRPVQYYYYPAPSPRPVRYYYYSPAPRRIQRSVRINPAASTPYMMPPMNFPVDRIGIPAGMNFPPPML
jgi:hypothetical protein